MTDFKYEIIPFEVIVTGSIVSLFITAIMSPQDLLNHIVAGMVAGLFFLLIFLVTKGRGMGFGDVVYAVFMGLLLGYPFVVVGLYIAFVLGALISLILIALKKKKLHGGTIAFGPFLVTGTFIMMIKGEQIMQIIAAYLGGV